MFFDDIETERLILRSISASDREFMFRQFSDADVCRYLFDEEPFTNIDEADGLISFYTEGERDAQHRFIVTLKDGGEKIGTCGLHCYDEEAGTAEVGYDLAPEYRGRGMMSEAMRAALHAYSERLDLREVNAHIYEENAASIRLAERLGFKFEGSTLMYSFRGKDYPHRIYTLRLER